MPLTKSAISLSTVFAVGAALVVTSSPASADPTIAGTYNALPVTRIVDTRTGTGAPERPVAPGQTITVAATAGITGSVSAVNLTVTAVTPTRSGFLTAYSGSTRPAVATVNFAAGESAPNAAFVKVASGGTVSVYNGSPGTVQIAVDRAGYWTGGGDSYGTGAFVPSTPARLTDSRVGGSTAIPARSSRSVDVSTVVGDSGADSVVLNVGAATPAGAGYLTVTGAANDQNDDSRTSTVSFSAGRSRSGLVVVPVTSDDTISIFNGATTSLNYVVDVVGYVTGDANGGGATDGGSFVIASPTRVADSRVGGTPIGGKATRVVQVVPSDLPQGIISALIVHVTATKTTQSGFLTAWDGTARRPNTSVTNFTAGVARTGTVIVPVSKTGTISLYNGSTAPVSYVIDMQGLVVSEQTGDLTQATAQKRVATTLKQIRTAASKYNR